MKDKDGKFIFTFKDDAGNEVPVWDYAHFHDINVDRVLYEEYRPLTHMKHKHVAPYDELAKDTGMRWPVVEQPDGSWQGNALPLRRGRRSLRRQRARASSSITPSPRTAARKSGSARSSATRKNPTPTIRSGSAPAASSSTGTAAP